MGVTVGRLESGVERVSAGERHTYILPLDHRLCNSDPKLLKLWIGFTKRLAASLLPVIWPMTDDYEWAI